MSDVAGTLYDEIAQLYHRASEQLLKREHIQQRVFVVETSLSTSVFDTFEKASAEVARLFPPDKFDVHIQDTELPDEMEFYTLRERGRVHEGYILQRSVR